MPTKKKMSEKVDKRHRGKIKVGNAPDGEPIFKYASGKTKKEMEANLNKLKRAHVTGNTDARHDILFGQYVNEWYEAYKKPYVGGSSHQNYITIINKYLLPEFGEIQMRAITTEHLQRFFNIHNAKSKTTVGYMRTILCRAFERAVSTGIIDRNPAVGLAGTGRPKSKRRALTDKETKAVLKVGSEHPEGILLLLLFYTGIRIGEALGLQWRDVDFAARKIKIERDVDFHTGKIGSLKTPASERTIPLPTPLYNALCPIRGFGATHVIQAPLTGGYIGQSTFKRKWDRLMTAVYNQDNTIEHRGIREPKDDRDTDIPQKSILTAHYLRHNYTTILYNAGVDVLSAAKWLGHKDITITLNIYAHLGTKKENANAKKLDNAFGAFK